MLAHVVILGKTANNDKFHDIARLAFVSIFIIKCHCALMILWAFLHIQCTRRNNTLPSIFCEHHSMSHHAYDRQVLQKLGKADETKDAAFEEGVINFNKQYVSTISSLKNN